MTEAAEKLRVRGIRKVYPGTVALAGVDLTFRAGEVHALLGKNGAGKSTLVKILSGAIRPTAGSIHVDGREVALRNPADAFAKGIATVYQELSLFPALSVAENILFGRLPRRGPGGLCVDWKAVREHAEAVLSDLEIEMDVDQPVGALSVARQQLVEIAKAMSVDPAVLMLDEPTSALAYHETKSLFRLVRRLADRGVAVIYISHRLQELKEVADVASVLRDGEYVGAVSIAEATSDVLANMIFGKTVPRERPDDLTAGEEPVLEVKGLGKAHRLFDVDLTLKRGEILGVAGMLGSGRTELLKAVFGAEPPDCGEIRLGGRVVRRPTPGRMKRLGVALTPEDRKAESLVQVMSVRDNLCLAGLDRLSRAGVMSRRRVREAVTRLVEKLDIKISDVSLPVSSLSGGNQQKVVVGKWENTDPSVFLFDEPTRGIDIEAKQQIFQIMWDLSRDGIASIFVSSELEELLEVCHRIVVMKQGRLVEEVTPGDDLDFETLFAKCLEE